MQMCIWGVNGLRGSNPLRGSIAFSYIALSLNYLNANAWLFSLDHLTYTCFGKCNIDCFEGLIILQEIEGLKMFNYFISL